MARDEFGMPLPDVTSHLPWEKQVGERLGSEAWLIVDANGMPIHENIGIIMEEDADFISHAANNIIPARDIVRRLAEWSKSDSMDDFIPVIRDAEKLWEKMQKEAGDERLGVDRGG
jgi:hypothetical protein